MTNTVKIILAVMVVLYADVWASSVLHAQIE